MYLLFVSSYLLFAYLAVRLIYPLRISRRIKLIAVAALFLISSKQIIIHYFFGGLAAPELSRTSLILSGWLFGSLFVLFMLTIAKDLILGLAWVFRKTTGFKSRMLPAANTWALLLMPISLILGGYGAWQAIAVPDVKMTEVVLPNLPRELDGLTIVQLTDLHISELFPANWLKAVIDKTNALTPDLILLTGDMIDGSAARRKDEARLMAELSAKHGVIACMGNHEYISGVDEWNQAFRSLGLTILNNQMLQLDIEGQSLIIAGVTDPAAQRPRFNRPGPDIKAALEGAPDNAVKILLAHQPRLARENAAAGVHLQLSGHTHGAQVIGLGTIGAKMNNGFLKGWYDVGGMKLYVSQGTGLWNGFPIRLGISSEITKITLRSSRPE